MNTPLDNLKAQLETHHVRLSRDWTTGTIPGVGSVTGYSVVTTRPGARTSPFLTAMVLEYEGGGYELFLPSTTNSIEDDVLRVLGTK